MEANRAIEKTIAVRALDQMKIAYELRPYDYDEDQLEATIVAEKIGLVPQQVFKTLVARGNRAGVVMAGVAADMELDLKALAKIVSDKKLELVAVKELLSLTGYIRGGVSPLGVKKRYPFYLDATALEFPVISISAGRRGLQVLLSPVDLTKITSATVAKIGVRL